MHNGAHERSSGPCARTERDRGLKRSHEARAPRWATGLTSATALVIAALLVGCGSPPGPSTPTSASPASTLPPSPSPRDLKPVLGGLLDRSGAPPTAYAGALSGYVVGVHWRDLQPVSGAAIAPDNPIDLAIAQVAAVNAADHTHLGLKIRVLAGVWAPEWAKSLGGSPVPVTNPQNGATGTIGRFWTDPFGEAYDHLETLLAAKYDEVAAVREVTISRCTTFYDEPFIRDASDPSTVGALISAGYTLEADETCQRQEIVAAAVWRHTHSDLAFNPYQVIESSGITHVDEPFTESMMVYCRQVLGTACVLENNSLRTPPLPAYAAMYAEMLSLGAPMAFQTAAAARVGDLQSTLNYALSLGADSVELPSGYESIAAPATFATTNHALAVQPSG